MLITGPRGEPVELDELDPAGLLGVLGENQLTARAAERDRLLIAHQWCVLHPATGEAARDGAVEGFEVGAFDTTQTPGRARRTARGPEVLTRVEYLAGQGAPAVAAFTAEPFATTLGVSTHAARKLLADALDLAHRLPRIWRRVRALEVEPFKARRVAELTRHLSQAAAAQVDAELAPTLATCTWVAIERAVATALAVHHPDLLEDRAKAGKATWDVTISHPGPGEAPGTSWLEATGDTLDLTAIHDRISHLAATLAQAGDTDPLGARRAKALGLLAAEDPDQALADLTSHLAAGEHRPPPRSHGRAKTHLYLHLSLVELLGLGLDDDLVCGEVEQLGPALVEAIRSWVGHSASTITPVIDLDRHWAVDAHDPPTAMAEQVILRDRHCVFPHCHTPARGCDLDHIAPYIPAEQGGPPGQTAPANLAPLCRRHHRAKTAGLWRYHRARDGTYTWHGPYGRSYTVTPYGTLQLDHAS